MNVLGKILSNLLSVCVFMHYFNPMISLDLLCVSDYRSSSGSGAVILDDCNFHESVRLDSFDMDRTLALVSET